MMKTNFLKTILVASIALFFANCSNDDDNPAPTANPEVNPLAGYLAATGFGEKTTQTIDETFFEFGLSFIPAVNGKITALVVKIPATNATLRMTIWDKSNATIIKTETINYSTADQEVTKVIDAVNLTAGTEYMVTFNSNDWYERSRNINGNASYPVNVGDIMITGYLFRSGVQQIMPNTPAFSYYSGDISFKFQKS